jgi:transposase
MYRDPIQWASIRKQVLSKKISIRGMCREKGISRNTIKKMLATPSPPIRKQREFALPVLGPHVATLRRLAAENSYLPPTARLTIKAMFHEIAVAEGFSGGYSTVRDFVSKHEKSGECVWSFAYDMVSSLGRSKGIDFLFMLSQAEAPLLSQTKLTKLVNQAGVVLIPPPKISKREARDNLDKEWLLRLMHDAVPMAVLQQRYTALEELDQLLELVWTGKLSVRNKAMAVLARKSGVRTSVICDFLNIDKHSFQKYCKSFDGGGVAALLSRKALATRKYEDEKTKQAVFALLHESPQASGYNRTSWRMVDFVAALAARGTPACPDVIRTITKAAGYKWRKARTVLTSNDPDYRNKLNAIQKILSTLTDSESFFSIDEYGPFAIKAKGGKSLMPPGVQKTVPQWQKSKGCLILTAALELSENQVHHFYSLKKNTAEMIKMMHMLLERYPSKRTIYLSWDAASWHVSKRLESEIASHNATAVQRGLPIVKTAPLPAGAQFLNVIESVFSGMARAIMHNSDYASVEHAKKAIERYFSERNAHFMKSPRRAGKKIWGCERVLPEFSPSNNCKDPRYR